MRFSHRDEWPYGIGGERAGRPGMAQGPRAGWQSTKKSIRHKDPTCSPTLPSATCLPKPWTSSLACCTDTGVPMIYVRTNELPSRAEHRPGYSTRWSRLVEGRHHGFIAHLTVVGVISG